MVNKDRIIDIEIFHQEMGKLIFSFDQIIETVKYDSKELLVYYVLIKRLFPMLLLQIS